MNERFLENKITAGYIKVMPFLFAAGGLILLFGRTGWWPSFYNPTFYGWAFLFSAGLLAVPRLLFKTSEKEKNQAVDFLTFVLATALALNLLGELYFYQLYLYGFQYDKVIHFGNSFLFFWAFVFLSQKKFGLSLNKSLLIAFAGIVAGSLLWELTEFGSDFIFKTTEFGIYGQFKEMDTIFDLLFNLLGAMSGAIFLSSPALDNYLYKIFFKDAGKPFPDKSESA